MMPGLDGISCRDRLDRFRLVSLECRRLQGRSIKKIVRQIR